MNINVDYLRTGSGDYLKPVKIEKKADENKLFADFDLKKFSIYEMIEIKSQMESIIEQINNILSQADKSREVSE